MKRILHLVGRMDRGGAETMVMNLYRAIDRSRIQFDFVYFTDKDPCDYDEEILQLGGRIFRINERNPFRRLKALTSLIAEHPEWETVHSHMLLANAFNIFAAYKAGVPRRISHAHSTKRQSRNRLVSKIYEYWATRTISKYSTHFVACGTAAASYLFPTRNDVLILPNSIDIEYFARVATDNRNALRAEFGVAEDILIIVQIGRLIQVKNHKFTIRVAEALINRGVKFRMFFAGQGELRDELEQMVQQKGLSGYITFLGIRSDVAKLLAGADLMLMPSLYEGFPVVMVETQASGLPSLIADTISPEVDLGVGLVKFCNLGNSAEVWAEVLTNWVTESPRRAPSQASLDKIKRAGFDISTNVHAVEKIYI